MFHRYAIRIISCSIILRMSEIIAKGFKNLVIETLKCKLLPYCMLSILHHSFLVALAMLGIWHHHQPPLGTNDYIHLQFLNYLILLFHFQMQHGQMDRRTQMDLQNLQNNNYLAEKSYTVAQCSKH